MNSTYRFDAYGATLAERAELLVADASTPRPFYRTQATTKFKPKVIFTSPDWAVSGVNTFTQHLVSYLNANGIPAEIVFTQGRFGSLWADEPPPVPHRFLQPVDGSRESRLGTLERYLIDCAPCIVVPNYDYESSALSARLPSSVGVVGIAHSDDPMHYEHCYRLGSYWNGIVGVSQEITDTLARLNPAFTAKLHTIPYGVPMQTAEAIADAMTRERSISEKVKILYVGRLVQEQKRILDFPHVVRALEARGISFELTLIGEGAEEALVKHQLARWIESGSVVMPGRLKHDEIYAAALQSHVFMLLSDYEGLPLSMLEAMGSGCVPVISDIVSGIRLVVDDAQTGFVVRPRDWARFAETVSDLQRDPSLWVKLSTAARDRVIREGLNIDGMGTKYEKVFRAVLADLDAQRTPRMKPLTVVTPGGLMPPPPVT